MARLTGRDRGTGVVPIIVLLSCSALALVWAPSSAASQKATRSAPAHSLVTPEAGTRTGWDAAFSRPPELIRATTALSAPARRPSTASPVAPPTPTGPRTSEHYTVNGNFSGSTYQPGRDGFNLADVSSNAQAAALPAGVKGLVWIGSCAGATRAFRSKIQSYVGNPKVLGFYLMDEPDPSSCPAARLKAESNWIHTKDAGKYTFIVEQDLASTNDPTYAGGYNHANSHVDLYGLDPYPCRSDNPASAPCSYSWIRLAVAAARRAGISPADIVPVYQAFGGGTWVDDGGGSYRLPTAGQESRILSTWASLVPTPVFDYAYSWGSQRGDRSLRGSSALRRVFSGYFETEGRDHSESLPGRRGHQLRDPASRRSGPGLARKHES